MSSVEKKYKEWLTSDIFDEATKEELRNLNGDAVEIRDRFYKDLEFGTGGLRAVIGAGTNRLNKYTIRRITSGYAAFLLESSSESAREKGIVIAYDMRHGSLEFALEAARVLSAVGIPTYLFKKITPTPELSFAVPYLNAAGGIVITASHNPPEYNGYKIYDETGCQAIPSLANLIIEKINAIKDYHSIEVSCKSSKMIHWLDEEIDTAFIEAEKSSLLNPEAIPKKGRTMKILYTPLHGTGKYMIFRALKELGFENIYTVDEQLVEDPDFKTVKSPNPEELSAFEMAISVGKENNVDLIMGSDPDSDRIGVLVKTTQGEYTPLNGNQIGALLVYYLLSNDPGLSLKRNPFIANTVVTSPLGAIIAESFNVETISTLTGFKFIGEQINLQSENKDFIMGYEESYGYLVGTHARDKDAVGSAMVIAEMAAFYISEGKNLIDQLNFLYQQYGFYKEELISKKLVGQEGMDEISRIMSRFRYLSPEESIVANIVDVKDYSLGIDGLPNSNVLKFFFDTGSWIAVRPSGTEPKIKFYLGAKGNNEMTVNKELEFLKRFVEQQL